MKLHLDIDQGSVAWFKLRAGIVTASEMHNVIMPKRMQLSEARHKYACRLLAERLMNWQAESLDKIEHIARGRENEPHAIRQLEFVHDIKSVPVGFATTDDGLVGASPDRVIMETHTPIEVKSPSVPVQFQYLLLGHDDAYRPQVQAQIMVMEADHALFYAYNPRMPEYYLRTDRDDIFITKMQECLDQFHNELAKLHDKAISLGVYQAFEEIVTPAEAEYATDLHGNPINSAEALAAMIESGRI